MVGMWRGGGDCCFCSFFWWLLVVVAEFQWLGGGQWSIELSMGLGGGWLVACCRWPGDELFDFGWLVVQRKRHQGIETERWGRRERESYMVIYYIILLGNLYYCNGLYLKISES